MVRTVAFLDLDGVLADYYGGVCRAFGHKPWPYLGHVGRWDFFAHPPFSLKDSDVAPKMDAAFYAGLDVMADAHEIVTLVEDAFGPGNVYFLSSPWDTPGCDEGKRAWVNRHFPWYARRTLIGSCKDACSYSGSVLFDDSPGNCKSFMLANAGKGVLVPRPWNDLHSKCDLATGRILDVATMFSRGAISTVMSALPVLDRAPEYSTTLPGQSWTPARGNLPGQIVPRLATVPLIAQDEANRGPLRTPPKRQPTTPIANREDGPRPEYVVTCPATTTSAPSENLIVTQVTISNLGQESAQDSDSAPPGSLSAVLAQHPLPWHSMRDKVRNRRCEWIVELMEYDSAPDLNAVARGRVIAHAVNLFGCRSGIAAPMDPSTADVDAVYRNSPGPWSVRNNRIVDAAGRFVAALPESSVDHTVGDVIALAVHDYMIRRYPADRSSRKAAAIEVGMGGSKADGILQTVLESALERPLSESEQMDIRAIQVADAPIEYLDVATWLTASARHVFDAILAIGNTFDLRVNTDLPGRQEYELRLRRLEKLIAHLKWLLQDADAEVVEPALTAD